MDGIVVIGEGEKDEAPMLYNGEKHRRRHPPETDIAVDPIDGTTLTSLGRGNALAVIAVSDRGTMFNPGPCVYMDKIAVGPECKGVDRHRGARCRTTSKTSPKPRARTCATSPPSSSTGRATPNSSPRYAPRVPASA